MCLYGSRFERWDYMACEVSKIKEEAMRQQRFDASVG